MNTSIKFSENVSLAVFTTMKLGSSRARYFYRLRDVQDLAKIHLFAVEQQLPIRILGSGSNSLATDKDFNGIVLKNELQGITKQTQADGSIIYQASSGEVWDDFVAMTTAEGMTGLECTSGIPGTVGATPIQNVGAYGQEICETMVEFEAYDFIDNHLVTVKTQDLDFAYRTSTLKTHNINRYFITKVSFHLKPGQLQAPLYWSLDQYIKQHQLSDFSPAKIRDYVLAIRSIRIPDYQTHPSAGSFFENAEISPQKFEQLKRDYPDIPYGTPQANGLVKIPSAWLIEQTAWAGKNINGIEVTAHNPMILVNRSATSFNDLVAAKQQIIDSIREKFDISLDMEPITIA